MEVASSQNTTSAMLEGRKGQNSEWAKKTARRFSHLESAIEGADLRQGRLRITALSIVESQGNVRLGIDKIQTAQSQTSTDYKRASSAKHEQQKAIGDAAVMATPQQRNDDGAQSVHGRATSAEGKLGKAEQAAQILSGQHAQKSILSTNATDGS